MRGLDQTPTSTRPARAARSIHGGRRLYRDPSIGLDDAHDFRIMYEARAEPDLSSGNTLVISYNVNSVGVNTGCQPMASYTNTVTLPRFVTVPLAAFGPASAGPFGAERAVGRSGDRAAEPGAMVRLVGPAARLPAHTRRNLGARQRGLGPGQAELARCRAFATSST